MLASSPLKNKLYTDEKTIGELAVYIKKHHPEIKRFDRSGFYRMKQFYETYANTAIVAPVAQQLQDTENEQIEFVSPVVIQLDLIEKSTSILAKISWTHHLIIMSRCQSEQEREFYIKLCIRERSKNNEYRYLP